MKPTTLRVYVLLVALIAGGTTAAAQIDVPRHLNRYSTGQVWYELAPAPLPPLAMPAYRVGEREISRQEIEKIEALLRERARLQQQPSPPPPQEEFKPISELPPEERLPAAPMLVAAYVFVTLALFGYVYSLTKRLGTVKAEIARLESDVKRSGRG